MKEHRFRITVEYLADAQGVPQNREALQFEVGNHDDIFAVVERLRARDDLGENAAAFGVGLKLFSEVMLKDRNNPLFAPLLVNFGEFMKGLKKGPGKAG